MTIQSKILAQQNLTIYSGEGIITHTDILAALKTFFAGEPTLKVLWDLQQASLTQITADQLRLVVQYSARFNHTRAGGKTALLVSQRLGDYGMGRMIEILGNMAATWVETAVFRDFDEAVKWLDVTL
ncbi:MAG: hypothetical protein H6658_01540 [Ardenticatenaceae bacterium]|nr:hypothetical protein [Ardenticatenaceae bacterium]